jgi:hypothetical protein
LQRRPDSYSSRGSSKDAWTHDLFDRDGDREAILANNPLAARLGETYLLTIPGLTVRTSRPARLKVENLHYDLSEGDLTVRPIHYEEFLIEGFVQQDWNCSEFTT